MHLPISSLSTTTPPTRAPEALPMDHTSRLLQIESNTFPSPYLWAGWGSGFGRTRNSCSFVGRIISQSCVESLFWPLTLGAALGPFVRIYLLGSWKEVIRVCCFDFPRMFVWFSAWHPPEHPFFHDDDDMIPARCWLAGCRVKCVSRFWGWSEGMGTNCNKLF